MAANGQDWITPASIATFGGASLAVLVVSNTARVLLRRNSLWVPFGISVLIAFALATAGHMLRSPLAWLLSLINSCLLFTSSVGINDTVAKATEERPAGEPRLQGVRPQRWLQSWTAP